MNLEIFEAEQYVHDVLNVFMCTGFTRDTGQYFMKASPVRPGDYLEFFAEINLIAGLSACPGDCSSKHSSNELLVIHLKLVENLSKSGLRELSLCVIRTLDAMGPTIKLQNNQKYYRWVTNKCIICSLILI